MFAVNGDTLLRKEVIFFVERKEAAVAGSINPVAANKRENGSAQNEKIWTGTERDNKKLKKKNEKNAWTKPDKILWKDSWIVVNS